MSQQAIVNPDELEQFAHSLSNFNAQLRENMARLQGQFQRLGDTWQDQEQSKFAQEFEQTMRVLHQFNHTSDAHIPFLLRKAQSAREYLNQR